MLWYDAQDINLAGNAGISNGDPISTWKNKGSLGATGDATGSGTARPTFKAIAQAGKLNNKSSVLFDNQAIQQGLVTAAGVLSIAGDARVATIWRTRDSTVQGAIWAGLGFNDSYLQQFGGTLYVGPLASSKMTGYVIVADQYALLIMTMSAVGTLRANESLTFGPWNQPGAFTEFHIGNFSGNLIGTPGDIVETILWDEVATSVASIEAYFNAKYGSSWPQ